MQRGVSTSRTAAGDKHWELWSNYTHQLGLDPLLKTIKDKVPIVQVFLHRVRSGKSSASGNKVRSRTAEEYIRSIGQTYLSLGAPDLRLDLGGNIDFRLTRMLKAYAKSDPPPNRVKPVPITVVRRIMIVALAGQDPFQQCIADMICIGFFFLLRPGEYTISPSESTPFELKDVQLFFGQSKLNLVTASDAALLSATFGSLTFNKQKNGVQGEVIGHGPSGNPALCPVCALAR